MQYNVFFVELLGDEDLSGVLIPVVIDTKNTLSDEKMAAVARLFNNYRVVFVKKDYKNVLITSVYSVAGRVKDCFYANAATVYALTRQSYIRDIEEGRSIKIVTDDCSNMIQISQTDDETFTIAHEIDLGDIEVDRKKSSESMDIVQVNLKDSRSTILIDSKDSKCFSQIRRKKEYYKRHDLDYLSLYVDESIQTIFFHVYRSNHSLEENRIESRVHIEVIISYLLDQGYKRQNLKKICHVLNTGQYAIIDLHIDQSKVYTNINSRTMVEGIVNI